MIEYESSPATPPSDVRNVWQSLLRGWQQACPSCGTGALYHRYLKVSPACPDCGEELHHHRADDAPPYFTILVIGHIIIGGLLMVETHYAPPTWVHYVIWLPLLLIMCLWFLPRIKGALVSLQWALRMHGFGGPDSDEAELAASKTHWD
jgi:uncharacterized protein (DUF983 family)